MIIFTEKRGGKNCHLSAAYYQKQHLETIKSSEMAAITLNRQ